MGEFLVAFFIVFIPCYGAIIWTYLFPEDSILQGRRWMYTEEPQITDEAIRRTKNMALIYGAVLTLILMSIIIGFLV